MIKMNNLFVEGTLTTPTMLLDYKKGVLELKGRSIPENSTELYRPLMEALSAVDSSVKKLDVSIALEYFNTSSSKCILDLLNDVSIIKKKGQTDVVVNWLYEEDDEDMLESGENYQELIDLEFNMIPIVD